ncbi:MAG: threonine-phosphate decarboxylase CobD [Beijerinckiaceae bacterium]
MLDSLPTATGERPSAHGGDLEEARRCFPKAPTPWIDLSTGINPIAFPVRRFDPDVWERLPQPGELRRLEGIAGEAYGIGIGAEVVAAPGTQALIQWLPQLFRAERVGILETSYDEHAASWRASGAGVTIVTEVDALAAYDVGVIVNPNNPDGRLIVAADLQGLARHLTARNSLLVIDEAFIDVMPESTSFASCLPASGLVVLRSFGKIFGLAGLRLGFGITGPELAEKLRRALGPWPLSGPALQIGAEALADAAWIGDARARLARDAARLDTELRHAGFAIIGGTPLFRLARHPDAAGWFERFGHAGIYVRRFKERPDQLRFGLPGSEEAWKRLSSVL